MAEKSTIVGAVPGASAAEDNKKPKGRKNNKDAIRRKFLTRLPKGGIAIEIGVWRGEFSPVILEIIQPDVLFLIDPWQHIETTSHSTAFVGRTNDGKMEKIFAQVKNQFVDEIEQKKVGIIRDFSVPAMAHFEDGSISFAYIDGDHSYEGVCADLVALFPKMKTGGVMAFDDYHRRGWWKDGVIRAVNEFIGAHAREVRVRAIAGAQIAIEKIAPSTN